MKKVTCYCSCGASHWSMEFASDGEYQHIVGISDDCPNCKDWTGKEQYQKPNGFKQAMGNVTPMKKRGRGR